VLPRPRHVHAVEALLGQFPVVAVLGARQVGKTTLARGLVSERGAVVPTPTTFFDLEDPTDRGRLADPKVALEALRGLVVIDEVQRAPELFPLLRVLADRDPRPAKFLILGSASPALLRQSSESLAGRIAFHHLDPFDLQETGSEAWRMLWLRGGFPSSFLADHDAASHVWRQQFTRTYLERDLSELGIRVASGTIRSFWTMVAHYHGQVWNGAELARAFGISQHTVRHYLDILCHTFMARRLQPWRESIGKREVKTPKVYIADSGLLHFLLGIRDAADLDGHPKVGASFEGFAIQQVVRALEAEPEECFFWGLHTGAELDLLIVRGRQRLGFEIKRTSSPRVTPSMRSALDVLGLERLDVVYAGNEVFPLAERVRAVGIEALVDAVRQ
jgi:predicted AAA+ superfamily ATPase